MSAAKPVNLALQGGGSHGAFTWGALDALIEDERIEIAGVSGASAGAMNAVVMAAGLSAGGRRGARAKLTEFWRAISKQTSPGSINPIVDFWLSQWKAALTPPMGLYAATGASSPYAFNPFDLNPLRDTLAALVDFPALRAADGPKLFVAATNVRTGKGAVFRRDRLTPEHVVASGALPHLFQAAIIDGEPYWDGGYSGNPPLWPLFSETDCQDTIIVQINPIARENVPRSASEINNRIDEITFNASLLAELGMAHFVDKAVHDGALRGDGYRAQRLHRIGGDGQLEKYSADSKFDASWSFLQELRDLGRASARAWLAKTFDDIGRRSTLDLPATLRTSERG
jgi:NTE family protein